MTIHIIYITFLGTVCGDFYGLPPQAAEHTGGRDVQRGVSTVGRFLIRIPKVKTKRVERIRVKEGTKRALKCLNRYRCLEWTTTSIGSESSQFSG